MASPTATTSGSPPRARTCVLTVDDSVDFREALAEGLETRGYLVVEASSGPEALELIELVRPDVILMDELMPGPRGSEVLRELRARGSAIPVVLMTAAEEARNAASRAGTPFWLSKPAELDSVEAIIERALGAARASSPARQLEIIERMLGKEIHAPVLDPVAAVRWLIHAKRAAESELEASGHDRTSMEAMELASLVAHELRSPLSALQLKLDRLRQVDGGLTARQLDVAEQCHGIILQSEKLIEGAMTYAAIETGHVSVKMQRVDLQELVNDVVALRRQHAKLIDVDIRIEISGPTEVSSDPKMLRIALANLIDNAVKFSRGGRVDIAVTGTRDGRRIAVRDSGPGIDEENRTRVFRAFERIENLLEGPVEGFGLGLAMVPRLVGTLGGRLELESELGAGSCFAIVLPVEHSVSSS